jgi:hypothetical protein
MITPKESSSYSLLLLLLFIFLESTIGVLHNNLEHIRKHSNKMVV